MDQVYKVNNLQENCEEIQSLLNIAISQANLATCSTLVADINLKQISSSEDGFLSQKCLLISNIENQSESEFGFGWSGTFLQIN
jgi:hypothetical protein